VELLKFTLKPPAGAAVESVRVPVLDVPPDTVLGETVRLAIAASVTVIVALASLTPEYDPVIVAL
jgi:hypothetical protein